MLQASIVLYTLHPHGPNTPNYFVKSKQILKTKGAKEYNDALQLSYYLMILKIDLLRK